VIPDDAGVGREGLRSGERTTPESFVTHSGVVAPTCADADTNLVVAGLLRDLAIAQTSTQRAFGYKQAANAILALDDPLESLVQPDGTLARIARIGPSSTRVIQEVLATGASPIVERAVDAKTRLIAVSFVSSVNGHMENIKALSDLAHLHKGYLFADIIQGCGSTPIDVRAMGIDFASTAMYKWLQGEHGFGFLYIKEDLVGSVIKPTEFTGHPDFN